MDNPTPEEIARHYSAMLDSVLFINDRLVKPNPDDPTGIDRNVRHLEHMLLNDWWAGYDLAPINAAIVSGKQ